MGSALMGLGKTEKTQYKTHLDYMNRNSSAKQIKMVKKGFLGRPGQVLSQNNHYGIKFRKD